jgi:hypothetical protein
MKRITLGRPGLVVAWAALLVVGLASADLLAPALWEVYHARVTLPAYHDRYGFDSALVELPGRRPRYEVFVITAVTPGGPFERAGFRAGDVPMGHHGDGMFQLAWALERAEDGHANEIRVATFRSVVEGTRDVRTLPVPTRP